VRGGGSTLSSRKRFSGISGNFQPTIQRMEIKIAQFRAHEGHKVKLPKWPTSVKPFYKSKKDYQSLLSQHVEALSAAQGLLYAHNRYALLLIF
jgi:hypothetical protein